MPDDVEQLHQRVQVLIKQVDAVSGWHDRLGSQVKQARNWRLTALVLLAICAVLAWAQLRPRPDILPYLYVVDPDDRVLWSGIPGRYTETDHAVLTHVRDFVEHARRRDDNVVVTHDNWQKAVEFTPKGSEAYMAFQTYMKDEAETVTTKHPRVTVKMLSQSIKSPLTRGGIYALSWQETDFWPSGMPRKVSTWEGEFTVTVDPPKILRDVEEKGKHGIMLMAYHWGERVPIGAPK